MIFILVHPTKRAMSSPLHTIRISLKMIKLIKFTTLAHSKNTLLPTANHCWTYNRPRNHTESTVCSKNTLAKTYSKSQLYRIYCITQKCLTAPRSRPLLTLQQTKKPHRTHCVFQEHPCWNLQQVTVIQNPSYNQETPHNALLSRQTTSTDSLYHELHPNNSRTQ